MGFDEGSGTVCLKQYMLLYTSVDCICVCAMSLNHASDQMCVTVYK